MTTRERWDQMRSLIEAGWHSGWGEPCSCGSVCRLASRAGLPQDVYCRSRPSNFIDTKQAQHDGSRQIYGDAGKFMRGGERQC